MNVTSTNQNIVFVTSQKHSGNFGGLAGANAYCNAAAAAAGGKQFELVTYPGANHDFVKDGMYYNPSAYDDALRRTAARLKDYLGE